MKKGSFDQYLFMAMVVIIGALFLSNVQGIAGVSRTLTSNSTDNSINGLNDNSTNSEAVTINLSGNGTATVRNSTAGLDCMISGGVQTGICSLPWPASAQNLTLVTTAPPGTTFNWNVPGCISVAPTCSQNIAANQTWNITVNPSPYLGWWTFDDGSGNTVDDSSGAGNNGTLINSPAWTTSLLGSETKYVLQFNGSNQYISLGNILQDSYNNLSISCWVKTSGTNNWQYIVSRGIWNNPDGIGLMIDYSGKSVDFGHYTGYVKSNADVQDNNWHLVVGTVAPNGNGGYLYSIYVDGLLDNTFTSTEGITPTTNSWSIGAGYSLIEGQVIPSGSSFNFNGSIDDVRIFNRTLNPSEVQTLYALYYPPVTVNLNITGSGTATFTSSPAVGAPSAIICSKLNNTETGTCSANFDSNQSITLTASSAPAGTTYNWGVSASAVVNGCTSTSTSCTINHAQAVLPTWNVQVTPLPPPSAPTSLTATTTYSQTGNTEVYLTWSPVSAAASYNVYRSINGGAYTQLNTEPYTNTNPIVNFTDGTVASGTSYSYKVTAVNTSGESAQSSAVTITPVSLPPAPTGVIAFGGTSRVQINFNPSATAVTYNIYRSTSATGTFSKVVSSVTPYTNNNGSCTSDCDYAFDSSVSNGQTYYYKVSGVSANGEGSLSSPPASAVTLAVPTGLTATAGNNAVTLKWTPVALATSYQILGTSSLAGAQGDVWTFNTTVTCASGSNSCSYTNSSLTGGTTYYYIVMALNGVNESSQSATVNATPVAPIAVTLTQPTGGTITCAYTSGGGACPSPITVPAGTSLTFTATESTGYGFILSNLFSGVTCSSLTGTTEKATCTTTINTPVTVTANFTPITYTITTSAGPNGSFSPAGPFTVNYMGTAPTINVIPASGYQIATVTTTVDGVSSTATPQTDPDIAAWSIQNVTANETISATFTPIPITVTITQPTGGTITCAYTSGGGACPSPITVPVGTSLTFTATESTGYGFTLSNLFSGVTCSSLTGTTGKATCTTTINTPVTVTANFTCTPGICPSGNNCGADTCGNANGCGSCPSGDICSSGKCNCTPGICPSGHTCGPDTCGNANGCGSCSTGDTCNSSGQCVCTPACPANYCGPSQNSCPGNCDCSGTNQCVLQFNQNGYCTAPGCQKWVTNGSCADFGDQTDPVGSIVTENTDDITKAETACSTHCEALQTNGDLQFLCAKVVRTGGIFDTNYICSCYGLGTQIVSGNTGGASSYCTDPNWYEKGDAILKKLPSVK